MYNDLALYKNTLWTNFEALRRLKHYFIWQDSSNLKHLFYLSNLTKYTNKWRMSIITAAIVTVVSSGHTVMWYWIGAEYVITHNNNHYNGGGQQIDMLYNDGGSNSHSSRGESSNVASNHIINIVSTIDLVLDVRDWCNDWYVQHICADHMLYNMTWFDW